MSELQMVLSQIREELARNERYLRSISRFHSIYQYDVYQRLYVLLDKAQTLAKQERDSA